jgi:glycosyltransferase involved in cell wall biosynthesis
MGKHKILFASSLKPAFDIRTEKLYQSFRNNTKYDTHFCGVGFSNKDQQINTYTWKYGRGIGFRLRINLNFLLLLLKIRPTIIILNNNDLLYFSIFYKLFFKCKIIFDIQENISNNITYQNVYSGLRKRLYLLLTHLSNKHLKPYCDGFILAEKCYEQELLFIRDKPYIVLENKFLPPTVQRTKTPKHEKVQILFSGTITATSGVNNALEILQLLNKTTPSQLTIIGHTPNNSLHNKLKQLASSDIFYKGNTSPIPHELIKAAIINADFGLICYEVTKANQNKFPTKLYEYLANKLPIISQKNSSWNKTITAVNGGIITSDNLEESSICKDFYANEDTTFALWEEKKCTNWFKLIIEPIE